MKLSEAIRLGAMMGPQCYGPYIHTTVKVVSSLMGYPVLIETTCATCAMGGALMAIGRRAKLSRQTDDVRPQEEFPILDVVVEHPVTGATETMFGVIVELNDHYHSTRERIADWVATIEVSQSAAKLPQPKEEEDEVPEADVREMVAA